MSIYTKTGDKGKSSTKNKRHVSKSAPVFDVLGSLDELNCTLGLLHHTKIPEFKKVILILQKDLMCIGSTVSGFVSEKCSDKSWSDKIRDLEKMVDSYNSKLKPLKSFILPGGCVESANLHVARVACRKFERLLVKYWRHSKKKDLSEIEAYVNRLSDLLFVLARFANKKKGIKDVAWESTK
jgi:cob(I)alamin adenosyltransferase